MSQVLHGLLYLHEQGVIHRDIKGANILTTKEGLVKLADFGVATKANGLHESSVVGTPYWMAPEVIELSGATTASDIWSLGCTVIELLDGKPPYHKLQPMPALFRIVNDDHPPLPESASPVSIAKHEIRFQDLTKPQAVQDFLLQCFQKDPNLRVSAKKLLKHPWIVNARRTDSVVPVKPTKYDEAVRSVQQWNEALKAPENGTVRVDSRGASASPVPPPRPEPKLQTSASLLPTPFKKRFSNLSEPSNADVFVTPDILDDNWDDDFATSISPSALHLPHLRPVDNFAGMLSADKLKAYANGQTDFVDENWDDQLAGKQPDIIDPNETVRPPSPVKNGANRPLQDRNTRMFVRTTSQSKTQYAQAMQTGLALPSRPLQMKRTSSAFKESGVEDYSDLVVEEDVALDQRFHQVMQVCVQYLDEVIDVC